jgi:hypothetical protein
MERFVGFWCPSPEFLAQSKRRERQCIGFKLQTAEKLNNNEEGYKI